MAPMPIERELLNRIVTEAPVVLYAGQLHGGDLDPVWVCPNAERILGCTMDEMYRSSWWLETVHPGDREQVKGVRVAISGRRRSRMEFRITVPEAEIRWVQEEMRWVADDFQGIDVVGSWTDVTRRRLLEERIGEERAMQAVGRLAGGIAHDFNNLLTSILGHADLLREHVDPDTEVHAGLEEMVRAAQDAAALTRRLLEFSGRSPLLPETLDPNALIRELGPELRERAGEPVDLRLDLEDLVGPVRMDPVHLARAIRSLVDNAVEAMPEGGRVEISTRSLEAPPEDAGLAPGRYLRLSVSDTGAGVDPGDLPHVFEPFFTSKDPGRGAGLGLALVHQVARAAGGAVRARSGKGIGTTVSLLLPLRGGAGSGSPNAPDA